MAKYLVLWETDHTKLPVDPKERVTGHKGLLDLVRKDISDGITKDWGAFIGENRGYAVLEGTEVEIGIRLEQYVPYVIFRVHAIASVDQIAEVQKALLK